MDIAKLAKEAGFNLTSGSYWQNVKGTDAELRKFADLVTAAEREQCAMTCDEIATQHMDYAQARAAAAKCAKAIRAS